VAHFKIVLIDSNPDESQFIAFQLTSLDYVVVPASSLKTGFICLMREIPDLILMESARDESLDFCQMIRQSSDLPIVVLGENHQKKEELKFLESGADDYILKPFSMEVLSLKIRAILRRRLALSVTNSDLVKWNSGRYS
jgi:DNA-binding response OmpR family regulator